MIVTSLEECEFRVSASPFQDSAAPSSRFFCANIERYTLDLSVLVIHLRMVVKHCGVNLSQNGFAAGADFQEHS